MSTAHDAAKVQAVSKCTAGSDGDGAGAADDVALVIVTHDAAKRISTILHGVQGNSGSGVAVLDPAVMIVFANDAANFRIASDAHVGDGDVLHGARLD